jgi:NAD kinase
MEKLQLEDFIVVKKKSRIEVDAMKMGLDWRNVLHQDIFARVKLKYNHNSAFIYRNLEAHKELYKSVDALRSAGLGDIIEFEEISRDKFEGKKAVVADGGDNHLIWVLDALEYLGLDLPVIAMNATPSHSYGGLLYYNKNTIAATIGKCGEGNYEIEKWPKIEGEIESNGSRTKLFPAASEYVLGEHTGTQMSRWVIDNEEQKGNRLIVCNGVGSSGWYSNIHIMLFGEKDTFARTSRELRHIIDGPAGHVSKYKKLHCRLLDREQLEIVSYNDERGVATADCINEDRYIHEFLFGSVARLWVSDKASKIIRC